MTHLRVITYTLIPKYSKRVFKRIQLISSFLLVPFTIEGRNNFLDFHSLWRNVAGEEMWKVLWFATTCATSLCLCFGIYIYIYIYIYSFLRQVAYFNILNCILISIVTFYYFNCLQTRNVWYGICCSPLRIYECQKSSRHISLWYWMSFGAYLVSWSFYGTVSE